MTDLCTFENIQPDDRDAVGGKGLSLARMAGAGLPVPAGFCVTSAVHRRLRGGGLSADPVLVEHIGQAYRDLGGGAVAVRSSATAEDGSVTSFAGQQETILGVQGEAAVWEAIRRCWASLDSERSSAYRRHQGVGDAGLAMAVVVQRLIDAEVAGVLFTRDPLDPTGQQMVVEASWGLGESVVSGRVLPDRFRLDRATGRVLDRHISSKTTQVKMDGPCPVPIEKQNRACLDDEQLAALHELGRRVEDLYGDARDVEWAYANGQFWLLQARPITSDAAEREQVRHEEIAALAARAEPGGTVWSRFNLSEILPEPTPMTWALVRRFMSGRGGFGLMYRDLGYHVDARVADEGAYDLIAGRPYCNLSREPLFYSSWLPVGHPYAALLAEPRRALSPKAVVDWSRVGAAFWLFLPLRLPFVMYRGMRSAARLAHVKQHFPAHFRQVVVPAFVEETRRTTAESWSALDAAALLQRLDYWVQRTLCDFARESLKPTVLAAVAQGNIELWLRRKLGAERLSAIVNELSGTRPDAEVDPFASMRALMAGRLDRAAFLERFGHRGPQEMELAQPRWAEDSAALERQTALPASAAAAPEVAYRSWEQIADEEKLSALDRQVLEPQVQALQTHVALRELGKHHLMRGYALIRRALVELDQRFGLRDGIFFLTPEELPQLLKGEDMAERITQRRRRRTLALSLEAPPVLFSTDLEALGRPMPVEGGDHLSGVPLAVGAFEGPALVLQQPLAEAVPSESYILVCPSTDPAWVPLFVRARGLVMETGGVLSHGAIVAREFGLPAVGGVIDATRRLRTGQRLRVDGSQGRVTVLPS